MSSDLCLPAVAAWTPGAVHATARLPRAAVKAVHMDSSTTSPLVVASASALATGGFAGFAAYAEPLVAPLGWAHLFATTAPSVDYAVSMVQEGEECVLIDVPEANGKDWWVCDDIIAVGGADECRYVLHNGEHVIACAY